MNASEFLEYLEDRTMWRLSLWFAICNWLRCFNCFENKIHMENWKWRYDNELNTPNSVLTRECICISVNMLNYLIFKCPFWILKCLRIVYFQVGFSQNWLRSSDLYMTLCFWLYAENTKLYSIKNYKKVLYIRCMLLLVKLPPIITLKANNLICF